MPRTPLENILDITQTPPSTNFLAPPLVLHVQIATSFLHDKMHLNVYAFN